jgi:IclR family pca regulon transcriptional regulator
VSTDASPEYVRSLARGLAVIASFSAGRPAMTISMVSAETGLTRATVRRILHTLRQLGFVAVEGDLFRLTPKVLSIGYSYLSGLQLPELAHPHMEQLVAQVHESSSLAILDGREIVYIARVPTRRIMSVTLTVGTRLPAFATSMGRVLLAGLPAEELEAFLGEESLPALTQLTVRTPNQLRWILRRVREQGYALTDQELEDGVRSIAVPVRNAGGQAEAALNIAAHAGRISKDTILADFLPRLLEAASAIEADLAHRSVSSYRSAPSLSPPPSTKAASRDRRPDGVLAARRSERSLLDLP